jgi:hypothetical protein
LDALEGSRQVPQRLPRMYPGIPPVQAAAAGRWRWTFGDSKREKREGTGVCGFCWMLLWCPGPDSNRYGLAAEGF